MHHDEQISIEALSLHAYKLQVFQMRESLHMLNVHFHTFEFYVKPNNAYVCATE